MSVITMIVPYYRQPRMLEKQLEAWAKYAPFTREVFQFIIVDDCSPEPAFDVYYRAFANRAPFPLEIYRVGVDIPWNRSMARNLGSQQARTVWLLHVDTDHILPPEAADNLAACIQSYDRKRWYKFRRFRIGRADDTRNKDLIPRDCKYGEIKPHVDSFLCTKELYWQVGGYDPDYAGCLGGGGAFLRQMKAAAKEELAPANVHLHVCTRDVAPDSSISTLSRDTSEYSRRRRAKERAGNVKVTNPIRYPWERVL